MVLRFTNIWRGRSSPRCIELLTLGADTTVSTVFLLLVNFNEQISRQYFHIDGSNDQLPAALAEQVSGAVRHGCRVVSIGCLCSSRRGVAGKVHVSAEEGAKDAHATLRQRGDWFLSVN